MIPINFFTVHAVLAVLCYAVMMLDLHQENKYEIRDVEYTMPDAGFSFWCSVIPGMNVVCILLAIHSIIVRMIWLVKRDIKIQKLIHKNRRAVRQYRRDHDIHKFNQTLKEIQDDARNC